MLSSASLNTANAVEGRFLSEAAPCRLEGYQINMSGIFFMCGGKLQITSANFKCLPGAQTTHSNGAGNLDFLTVDST